MAVIRQNNKVFNKPVGIVRSQETSSTSDLWKSISEASNAVSAIAMKRAVQDLQTKEKEIIKAERLKEKEENEAKRLKEKEENEAKRLKERADLKAERLAEKEADKAERLAEKEADKAEREKEAKEIKEAKERGLLGSMSVEVLDENGRITKAPINFGPVATEVFEKNMMQRYEIQMKTLLDQKILKALENNSSDAEDFNNFASIAVGPLIENAEPSFQGILKDYVATKIGAGQNTILANRLRIESEKTYALMTNQADAFTQDAINLYETGNKQDAEQRFEEAENLLNGMIDSRVASASQVSDITNKLRRQFVKFKLGQEVQDMSSADIQVVLNEYVQGNLKDDGSELKTILTTLKPEDFETAKRTLTNLEQNQKKIEEDEVKNIKRLKFISKLGSGTRVKIGASEMASYSQYAFDEAGLEFNENPTAEQITQLASSKEFLTVLAQQQKLPDAIKFKLEDMVNGIMGDDPDKAIALMEFYQSLENNVSITGVPRDITSAVGLDGELRTKLQGISKLLTFNNTPEGLAQILALANVPENDRISRAMTNINDKLKPQNPITTYAGARGFVFNKLRKEFDDNEIAEEVVDETLMLMNLLPAKEAMNVVTSTVKQKWKDSQYTVDFKSGGTAIRTRFAPETIFGEGTKVLQDFEQAVVDKSGVVDAELGKNVFVMVDPNSSNQNVRYYLMKGEEGISGIEPIIKDGKLVSIELLEYADDMQEQYQNVLLENLSYASQIAKIVKDAEDYIFVQQPIVNIDSSSVQEMYEGLK